MTMRPCIECGEPTEHTRCPRHHLPDPRGSATVRGYDGPWRRLSRLAIRTQPWCTDCRTAEDLTTDHSPQAWARRAAGKRIRLVDVDVVCRGCNARRGRARPDTPSSTRGETPSTTSAATPPVANFATLSAVPDRGRG